MKAHHQYPSMGRGICKVQIPPGNGWPCITFNAHDALRIIVLILWVDFPSRLPKVGEGRGVKCAAGLALATRLMKSHRIQMMSLTLIDLIDDAEGSD